MDVLGVQLGDTLKSATDKAVLLRIETSCTMKTYAALYEACMACSVGVRGVDMMCILLHIKHTFAAHICCTSNTHSVVADGLLDIVTMNNLLWRMTFISRHRQTGKRNLNMTKDTALTRFDIRSYITIVLGHFG
jgi:hypothetical protein